MKYTPVRKQNGGKTEKDEAEQCEQNNEINRIIKKWKIRTVEI